MVRNSILVSDLPGGKKTCHGALRTGKINGAIVVGVNLIDHVLKLRLGWVLTKRPHDCAQLLGGDLA